MDDLTSWILAAGALGLTAFGIVEAFKYTRIGVLGFEQILRILGKLQLALKVAYGDEYQDLLRSQYRGDVEELARTLRQGVRIGLIDKTHKRHTIGA